MNKSMMIILFFIFVLLFTVYSVDNDKNMLKEGYNRSYIISNKFNPTILPSPLTNNWGYYDPYRFGDDTYPHQKRYVGRYPYYRFGYNNVMRR